MSCREQPGNCPRKQSPTETLITSLGYCCPWFFLSRFRSNTTVANRLGISLSTVKEWRRRIASGEVECRADEAERCLRPLLKRKSRSPLP